MGMFKNLNREIEQIEKDKGIKKDVLIKALESAMLTAAKKKFGIHREIEAQYNPKDGEIELFEFKKVVDKVSDPETEITLKEAKKNDPGVEKGDELGMKMDTSDFGRIAAQTAKQVIIQKVREAESDMIFSEYKDKRGELIAGIIRRFEKGNIFVDLGRTEALLPASHQVPREHYRVGDRAQVYVLDIEKTVKDAQILVSRTDPGLLRKLFEMEVPEIYEGIVTIESAAREPGSRSKIAVSSKDSDIDAVGACVGIKGARVQSVVQELRGEKIDIVAYDEDPAKYICNAIAPADVSRVIIDEDTNSIELIVPDDQLSLAIGKKGQNVRLAAKLTGWRIDIFSESKIKELAEKAKADFQLLDGITIPLADLMYSQGIDSLDEFCRIEDEELISTLSFDKDKIKQLKAKALEIISSRLEKENSEENESSADSEVAENKQQEEKSKETAEKEKKDTELKSKET